MTITENMRGSMIPRKIPRPSQRKGASAEGGLRAGGPAGAAGSPGRDISTSFPPPLALAEPYTLLKNGFVTAGASFTPACV